MAQYKYSLCDLSMHIEKKPKKVMQNYFGKENKRSLVEKISSFKKVQISL